MAFEGCDSITWGMISHPTGEVGEHGRQLFDRAITGDQWAFIQAAKLKDGIFYNDSTYYKVEAVTGMNIVIRKGICQIKGHESFTQEDKFIELEPGGALSRTDRIVLRLDLTDIVRDVQIIAKKGTTELIRTTDIWEFGIADITVSANTTIITASNIKDLRLDPIACGIVDYIYKMDTTKFFTQFDAILIEIRSQMTQQQTDFGIAQTARQTDYETWKATIDAWKGMVIIQFQEKIGFNFNNQITMPGTVRTFDDSVSDQIDEWMRFSIDNTPVAHMRTVFNADNSIVETLTIYNADGVTYFNRTQAITTFIDDIPRTEVTTL